MPTQENDKLRGQERAPLADSIRLVSICLDSKSTADIREFIESLPMMRFEAAIESYPTARQLTTLTEESAMDVCLIDFDRDRAGAAQTAKMIHERMPNSALFAVSSNSQPEAIIQAMHCGCNEYLIKPLRHEQILQAAIRIDGQRRNKRASGEVLVFLGAKGGVGTTTVATQLGVLLARSGSQRTLLIDLHPTFGDADLYLGLTKHYQYSFRQLAENTGRLDTELLQGFLLHHQSGLDVLPAPEASESARPLPEGAIGVTLGFLRLHYEHVLIDCAPGLGQDNQEAIRHSEGIYLITVSEVASIRNVVRYHEYFTKQQYSNEIRTVLNRYSKRNSITDEQVEKAIRQPIFLKIPNQYNQVIETNNAGNLAQNASSDVARSIGWWAAQLSKRPTATASADRRNSKGLLTLLGG